MLGRLVATAYLIDAARRFTCSARDQGHHPAVVTAIMKGQATERLRVSVTDAMDVHGGKAIIEGPHNYLGALYRAVPIGITVEGANIVTRALIQFGQGSIRSHPYVLKEMLALEDTDRDRGLDNFDKAFWAHVGHSLATAGRAMLRAWTGGLLAPAPNAGRATPYYKQLGRYAAAFALSVDMALLTMGGALKRREMISARFADILSDLYLLSAVLKRWQDEGRQDADFPLVEYSMQAGLSTIAARFDELYANLPLRPVAWLLRFMVLPLGPRHRGVDDRVMPTCADLLMEASATRDRLTAGIYHPHDGKGLDQLNTAFKLVIAEPPIHDRMRKAKVREVAQALTTGLITQAEADQLAAVAKAVLDAVNVDDFSVEELTGSKTVNAHVGDKSAVNQAAE